MTKVPGGDHDGVTHLELDVIQIALQIREQIKAGRPAGRPASAWRGSIILEPGDCSGVVPLTRAHLKSTKEQPTSSK